MGILKTKKPKSYNPTASNAQVIGWILWLSPILLAVALLSLKRIFFVTADLGRHLTNGRIIFSDLKIFSDNFYSYTYPTHPFVNHHWGSGLIFHLVHNFWGFTGLSALNAIILTLTVAVILHSLKWNSTPAVTALCALACLPLITSRLEVRPESFSYLLSAIFFAILSLSESKRISNKYLYILPALMTLWVNLHIYFFLGFMLIFIQLLEQIISHKKWNVEIRRLGLVLLLSLLAAMVNPLGWNLVLYPLKIFNDYGYLVAENQSVFFFWNHSMPVSAFLSFHLVALLLILTLFIYFRERSRIHPLTFFFSFFSLLLASLAIRNFALMGLFAVPLLARTYLTLPSSRWRKIWLWLLLAGSSGSVFHCFKEWDRLKYQFGTGLYPNSNSAADFFKELGIKGPVFNNYDIGGYLIFHLFPNERVFVDNRPEAYPGDFFRDVYGPMQEDEGAWQEALEKYKFNAIFFYRLDNTPAGQKFLVSRIRDSAWRPIFVDDYALIMVRATENNRSLIENFALPYEIFKVN